MAKEGRRFENVKELGAGDLEDMLGGQDVRKTSKD